MDSHRSDRAGVAPPSPRERAGVYVHLPFCESRCAYCDFPIVVAASGRMDAYLDGLEWEIRAGQPHAPSDVDTVFFGGGTPSRVPPERIGALLDAIGARFRVSRGAEVTLEANPEDLDAGRLAGYRDCGVTRVSIGVQSLDDGVLRRAARRHDAARAVEAVSLARAAGVETSLDLIAGLPGEELASWERTARRAAQLGTDHVSVYLLELDKASRLAAAVRRGTAPAPDADALARAYERTVAAMEVAGLEQYEISNFARAGRRSRHNLKYWKDAWYAGFGLGAHGYYDGARRSNVRALDRYLDRVSSGRDPVSEVEPWDRRRRLEEALFLGLRLVEGVDLGETGRRYGRDVGELFRGAWARAEEAGLVERAGPRVRLTPRGRLLSNELFGDLVAGPVP